MKNGLSIDLEYWYSPEFLSGVALQKSDDQLVQSTRPLLDMLDRHKVKATFFVLGKVAEDHPDFIKLLHSEGHEIASHCYSHKTLDKLGRDGFRKELELSTDILKSITHEQPLGFRAPSFSINQSTAWAFDILHDLGYKYDSSIFPFKTMLYGVPDAPLTPYTPDTADITRSSDEGMIREFPMSVAKFLFKIPISGGFYLRALPYPFLDYSLGTINRDRPAVIYIHPWETYPGTPRVHLPLLKNFITYYGISRSLKKLDKIIGKYEFMPIREVLGI